MKQYETCKHSEKNIGEFIVYVRPTCPNLVRIQGTLCSSKMRCEYCTEWEPEEGENA